MQLYNPMLVSFVLFYFFDNFSIALRMDITVEKSTWTDK